MSSMLGERKQDKKSGVPVVLLGTIERRSARRNRGKGYSVELSADDVDMRLDMEE